MSLVDDKAFYGKYVTKKEKAISLKDARKMEREMYEAITKYDIAQGEIDRAHFELDNLVIPRRQKNGKFLLSLSGRIRQLKNIRRNYEEHHH